MSKKEEKAGFLRDWEGSWFAHFGFWCLGVLLIVKCGSEVGIWTYEVSPASMKRFIQEILLDMDVYPYSTGHEFFMIFWTFAVLGLIPFYFRLLRIVPFVIGMAVFAIPIVLAEFADKWFESRWETWKSPPRD